jgi:hypothetical protein
MSNFQLHVFSIRKPILLSVLHISVLCGLIVYTYMYICSGSGNDHKILNILVLPGMNVSYQD